jgi:hypothetical protein
LICKQKAGVTQRVPGAAPHEKITSNFLNQIGLLYKTRFAGILQFVDTHGFDMRRPCNL